MKIHDAGAIAYFDSGGDEWQSVKLPGLNFNLPWRHCQSYDFGCVSNRTLNLAKAILLHVSNSKEEILSSGMIIAFAHAFLVEAKDRDVIKLDDVKKWMSNYGQMF